MAVFSVVVSLIVCPFAQGASYTWNNFNGAGDTLWSSPGNWQPGAAASFFNTTLNFPGSVSQPSAGYTTTYDSAFTVNALVFSSTAGSSNTGVSVTGSGSGSTIRFNLDGATQPSITNNGTSLVSIANGSATTAMTIVGGTWLQILGNNLGNISLTGAIGETGGAGSVLVAMSGPGFGGTGALVTFGGTGSYTGGTILATGNVGVGSSGALGTGPVSVSGAGHTLRLTAASLTIPNNFVLFQSLNITGVNTGTFSGAFTGSGGISVANTATMTALTFTNAGNSFSGPVVFNPVGNAVGGITLNGNGSFTSTSGLTFYSNTSLTIDNSGTNVSNRLNPGATLTLHRGNFFLTGSAAGPSTESLASLASTGTASFTLTPNAAQASSITFGNWTRSQNSTASIRSVGLGGSGANTGNVIITANPGGAIGGSGLPGTTRLNILPYAVGDTTSSGATLPSLVRWDADTGRITPLDYNTEYAANLYTTGVLAPTGNFRRTSAPSNLLSGGVTGLNAATVNALVLNSNAAATPAIGVSVAGPGILTVGSGTILNGLTGSTTLPTLASMINTGGLDFGANTGYIHTLADLTINSPISGSGGVVKSAFGVLILNGANTFTGDLTVNSGNLRFSDDASLGAAANQLVLNGGITSAFTYQPPALFNDSVGSTLTLTRTIAIGSAGTAIGTGLANGTLELAGTVGGTGQLYISTGYVKLTGTFTQTAP
ncbi:MAG: beta strand repeat-containing protein, partial [Chthoniobacterales bacterium]